MGELILCKQALAALPYYLEHAFLNIYSLEELGYYIENNLYLEEQDFMNDDFCDWVEQELKLSDTADKLRDISNRKKSFTEFIACLLAETGYCTLESRKQIAEALKLMERKSEFERIKMRGDRSLQNGKYVSAISDYSTLLFRKKESKENVVLLGNVWHNMGTAYARLFLFGEAANCFGHAYQWNQNQESLKACFYALYCGHDEVGFQNMAEKWKIGSEEQGEIKQFLASVSRMEDISIFEECLKKWFDSFEDAKAVEDGEVLELINEWKREYQKNCRI